MIILINGSINSGKTSVSKELVKRFDRCAHIEVDSIREFIRSVDLSEAIPINIENTILIAKNLLRHGFNLIISYPLPLKTVTQLFEALKSFDNKIYYFTLSPSIDTVLHNRGGRELSDSEKDRIRYHYQTGINNPDIGLVIDNTNQTINQTVDQIIKEINADRTDALL